MKEQFSPKYQPEKPPKSNDPEKQLPSRAECVTESVFLFEEEVCEPGKKEHPAPKKEQVEEAARAYYRAGDKKKAKQILKAHIEKLVKAKDYREAAMVYERAAMVYERADEYNKNKKAKEKMWTLYAQELERSKYFKDAAMVYADRLRNEKKAHEMIEMEAEEMAKGPIQTARKVDFEAEALILGELNETRMYNDPGAKEDFERERILWSVYGKECELAKDYREAAMAYEYAYNDKKAKEMYGLCGIEWGHEDSQE